MNRFPRLRKATSLPRDMFLVEWKPHEILYGKNLIFSNFNYTLRIDQFLDYILSNLEYVQ